MGVGNLLVFAVLALAESPDPAILIDRLGSPRYAEREAASTALEKLGQAALPVLRKAISSKDPEVRNRATALVEKIETSLLTQPTLVRLEFQDLPLEDVAQRLSDQCGIKFQLEPPTNPIWKARKLTLREPEAVPFWKAVDLLTQSAGLVQNPGITMGELGRAATLRLYQGISPALPSSDSGPFRLTLLSLHHHRDLGLANFGRANPPLPEPPIAPGAGQPRLLPAAAPPTADDRFYAQMQVVVEPRLMLNQSHELKLIEAVDDRGQSLLPPATGTQAQRYSGYSGFAPGSFLQLALGLKYPDQPSKSIARLKGVLPLTVSARKLEPLAVSLNEDAIGKPVRGSDAEITVKDFKMTVNRHTILVSIRPLGAGIEAAEPLGPAAGGFRTPNQVSNQIEVVDAAGKMLRGNFSNSSARGQQTEDTKISITILPMPGAGDPAELRYYSLTKTTTDVPFEFTNLPMP